MPRRRAHQYAGAGTGCALAAISAVKAGQDPLDAFIEGLGGLGAGYFTSTLADRIDPPISSWHWNNGHRISVNGAVGLDTYLLVPAGQRYLRAKAKELRGKRAQAPQERKFWYWIGEVLCLLASGALIGGPTGHFSHLALDQVFSKRDLPW